MRLRTFAARDIPQAMALVRQELGDDAIIVSTESSAEGARIIAAIEEAEPALAIGQDLIRQDGLYPRDSGDVVDAVHEALLGHGLPSRLIDRLVDASFLVPSDDAVTALAAALTAIFSFRPLNAGGAAQPVILIGAPGAGKTMTAVKIAARHVMAGRRVRLITTDTVRAGAVEQLGAFARLLGAEFAVAESSGDLARRARPAVAGEQVLIDTAGINPRASADLAELAELIDASRAEPLLVMAAGGDVVEAMEQSAAMIEMGARRLVGTKIDTVRRLGSILAAADAGHLALADYGYSPSVANGLASFDAKTLSRMLMPEAGAAASALPMEGRA